jgi:hypothetical protein
MDRGKRSNNIIANRNNKIYMDLKDIIREHTLPFLPAKSLFRFKTVCRDSQLLSLPTISQIVSMMSRAYFVNLDQTRLHLSPLTQILMVFQTHLCSFCLNQLTSRLLPMAYYAARVTLVTRPTTSAILLPSSGRNSLNPMLIMGLTLPLY